MSFIMGRFLFLQSLFTGKINVLFNCNGNFKYYYCPEKRKLLLTLAYLIRRSFHLLTSKNVETNMTDRLPPPAPSLATIQRSFTRLRTAARRLSLSSSAVQIWGLCFLGITRKCGHPKGNVTESSRNSFGWDSLLDDVSRQGDLSLSNLICPLSLLSGPGSRRSLEEGGARKLVFFFFDPLVVQECFKTGCGSSQL
jgi:hypothetical protein